MMDLMNVHAMIAAIYEGPALALGAAWVGAVLFSIFRFVR